MSHRILVITIPPTTGGVPAKTRILCDFLRRLGHEVTLAYYATISDHPDLVVPSWRFLSGARPGIQKGMCFDTQPCVAVGCWLPELEFSYYRPSADWIELVAAHDRHIAVGGTILVSNILDAAKVPHMVWCASTMIDDRMDRRRAMPFARRVFDQAVIGTVQSRMERKLLGGGATFMAVSSYAADTLIAKGASRERMNVVPVPVDTDVFSPPSSSPKAARIGFAGRPEDPRKNLPLLLRAVAELKIQGVMAMLALTGEAQTALLKLAQDLGIDEQISFVGWLPDEDLPAFLQSLDVFVFASGKEGLGISGLQAMACGVPVVSTRCGGPEDYVLPGKTGQLTEATPSAMADALAQIINDRDLRARLSAGARNLMTERYTLKTFERNVTEAWRKTWNEAI